MGERESSRVNCFATTAVTFKPVGSNQDSAPKVSSPPGYVPRLDAKRGDSFLQADLNEAARAADASRACR
jgi:hypothetical protein